MEFVDEINKAIESGNEGYQEFITQKLLAREDYLEQSFWMPTGLQLTVLNYLIQQHQEPNDNAVAGKLSSNLTSYIDFVLTKGRDKNAGEPVHYAIVSGKHRLAIYLLEQKVFDVNRRGKDGSTLLSLALAAKNKNLLQAVLANSPNIHECSRFTEDQIDYQPLHQAIMANFDFGVTALVQAGAQLNNPAGPFMDTPVLLAARLGNINALAALLASSGAELDLEAENDERAEPYEHGYNAVEALCQLLAQDKNKKSLLDGVAMLLCHGAEPPRREEMRELLATHRMELLKAIDSYLEQHGELVDSFVRRCHLTGTPLHSIIYVDHSWGYALRQLLGRPSSAGLIVESWVTRKYGSNSSNNQTNVELSSKAGSTYTGDEEPLKLYAAFVARYDFAYKSQRITNPWSAMHWMIAEGQGSWELVLKYSKEHPTSRTRLIVNDMIKSSSTKSPHEDIVEDIASASTGYHP